jgi:secreted PhoX family phosphatase
MLSNRRSFLKHSALAGSALGLNCLLPRLARAAVPRYGGNIPGFGPLVPTPSENTGEVLLAVPEGFKYNLLIRRDNPMSDGRLFPPNADGMGAYDLNGLVRLVCNVERATGSPPLGAYPYDPRAIGGTVSLTVDPETRLLTDSAAGSNDKAFVSSSGTVRNCAGGVSPWGTWLTAEESALGPVHSTAVTKQHGYIFEVPAFYNGETAVQPLKNLGLHYPEAAVVDPATGIAYITSDRNPCGTFRFVPDTPGSLTGSGRVQMLAIDGHPEYDTRTGQQVGVKLPVTWVDIDDPSNEEKYSRPITAADRNNPYGAWYTYFQGLEKGGATFSRGEGIVHSRNSIFFATTDGGDARLGQIFELHLKNNDVQQLELIYESTDPLAMESPDNITISPLNNNIIVCEDGAGGDYLHLLRRSGNHVYRLAENLVTGFTTSEWAGACFSPDGKTLFANVYSAGAVFAIWTDHWGTIN